jgi:uncharacterized repeat protein (TIGR01451 family)
MARRKGRGWQGAMVLVALLCVLSGAQVREAGRAAAQSSRLDGPPAVRASGTATVYASQITISTYNYAGYLRTKYDSTYNMYYRVLDRNKYTRDVRTRAPHTYDTIVIENDYLAATIIPALGGRVYSLVFKPTGNNEFYSNTVIMPTRWGPPQQDWWLAAGGMEWCLPVDEHGYEWGIPWTAATSADGDGVYVTLTDTAATDRLRARITLHLPHDKACLRVTPRIENPAGRGFWYKYWTNVQVAPGPSNTLSADFHFILPTDEVTIHSTGDSRVPKPKQPMSWPIYKGLNWARLGTWDEWIGFFARPAASRDYQGVYDYGVDEGLARVFPATLARGAKGFAWGWNDAYPSSGWTHDGSYYAEVHGGIAPTFWDLTYLPPGGAIEWTETWYPVAGTGGLTTANAQAALNLRVSGDQVTVGAQPTSEQPGGLVALWRPGDAGPLQRAAASLSPGTPYQATFAPGGDLSELVLSYLDGDRHLLATTEPAPGKRPPVARVNALPPYVTSPGDLVVSWSGSDEDSCVLEYDVQVRDGYDGAWTDWLTRTTAISSTYASGTHRHTYYFRVRARDLYGNLGSYGGDEWGEAFCSVLTSPAPVLETSRKGPSRFGALGGDVLTYTLSLRNTGNADAATVWMTDTIPAELTLLTETIEVNGGGPVTHTTGQVSWQGTVTAGHTVEVVFATEVLSDVVVDLRPVTNTMIVEHQDSVLLRQGAFVLGHTTFYPLVFRGW